MDVVRAKRRGQELGHNTTVLSLAPYLQSPGELLKNTEVWAPSLRDSYLISLDWAQICF